MYRLRLVTAFFICLNGLLVASYNLQSPVSRYLQEVATSHTSQSPAESEENSLLSQASGEKYAHSYSLRTRQKAFQHRYFGLSNYHDKAEDPENPVESGLTSHIPRPAYYDLLFLYQLF